MYLCEMQNSRTFMTFNLNDCFDIFAGRALLNYFRSVSHQPVNCSNGIGHHLIPKTL